MKVYLAAPWTHKPDAFAVATTLRHVGHTITTEWWNHREALDEQTKCAQAMEDRSGVKACDAFVVLCLATSEGKATELGMALAWSKPCFAVIPESTPNLFVALPEVTCVKTIPSLLLALFEEEQWQVGDRYVTSGN